MKKNISKRALIARIRRKLRKDNEFLVTVKENSKWNNEYGPYYIKDSNNCIIQHGIDDLLNLAKELLVLNQVDMYDPLV